jgi:hypothetical protein
VSRKELMDKLKPGSMGGTYAGNDVRVLLQLRLPM